MNQQLPLDLHLRDSASFENFVTGDNQQAFEKLSALNTNSTVANMFWLWGNACGKTHLLEAVCHQALANDVAVIYLTLTDPDIEPEMLEGLEQLDIVCIDNIDAVAGNTEWEQALFVLCERFHDQNGSLVLASRAAPQALAIALPDLRSRLLGWFMVFAVKPLDDTGKAEALRRRAHNRGLEIADEVVQYVLKRYPRDMHALFDLIEKIDSASLAQQRRITIPFLRSLDD